jgi:hypothetical protein
VIRKPFGLHAKGTRFESWWGNDISRMEVLRTVCSSSLHLGVYKKKTLWLGCVCLSAWNNLHCWNSLLGNWLSKQLFEGSNWLKLGGELDWVNGYDFLLNTKLHFFTKIAKNSLQSLLNKLRDMSVLKMCVTCTHFSCNSVLRDKQTANRVLIASCLF